MALARHFCALFLCVWPWHVIKHIVIETIDIERRTEKCTANNKIITAHARYFIKMMGSYEYTIQRGLVVAD